MKGGKQTRLAYSTGERRPEQPVPGPAPALRPAGIRLRLESRASGRLVTVVTGLPGSNPEKRALTAALKAACGAGGTFKGDALELQGDQRDKVEEALDERGLKWKRAGG